MASKKKKAAPRLSKAEKEALERRAAGQLKRKATLEAKKKAAAAAEVQDHRADSAAYLGAELPRPHVNMVLDAEATRQFLLEQSLHPHVRDAFIPPQPMCNHAVGSVAGPSPVSMMDELRVRLEDAASRQEYILGQLLHFQTRVGGDGLAGEPVNEQRLDEPKAPGAAGEIGALLSRIERTGAKLVDAVHRLDRVA